MTCRLVLTLVASSACGLLLAGTVDTAHALSCVDDVLLDKDAFQPGAGAANPDENDLFPEQALITADGDFTSDTLEFLGVRQ